MVAPGDATAPSAVGWWPSFRGSFALTRSNPATVLSFVALFGSLSASPGVIAWPLAWVAGVLSCSALSWLLLSGVVARLHARVGVQAQRWVSRCSALMLDGFAFVHWLLLA